MARRRRVVSLFFHLLVPHAVTPIPQPGHHLLLIISPLIRFNGLPWARKPEQHEKHLHPPPRMVGCCVVVVISRQLTKPPFMHPQYTQGCSFQALSSTTTCLSGFLLSRWFDILVVFFLGIIVIIIVVLVVRLFFVIFNFVGLWKTILYW